MVHRVDSRQARENFSAENVTLFLTGVGFPLELHRHRVKKRHASFRRLRMGSAPPHVGIRPNMIRRKPLITNTSDPLLTRREVAERWRQSTETVKRREKAGVLNALKLGRGVRYRLSDVLAFETAAEVGGRITAQ
jgi:hypothetical protein